MSYYCLMQVPMRSTYFLLIPLLVQTGFGQSPERNEILNTVNLVFEAMRTNDSTLLKTAFTPDVRMFTVYMDKQGKVQKREDGLASFAKAVGTPKKEVWNEPIWNERVEIDGPLASVWVEYAFYVDKQFSHCGVDAFHLMKTSEGWKIFHLVDTRRKDDCLVPKEIQEKFK
jgi:hypothetical protein